eukprot:scaffold24900_cov132-Isochrysis_galbana.AAC.8
MRNGMPGRQARQAHNNGPITKKERRQRQATSDRAGATRADDRDESRLDDRISLIGPMRRADDARLQPPSSASAHSLSSGVHNTSASRVAVGIRMVRFCDFAVRAGFPAPVVPAIPVRPEVSVNFPSARAFLSR